MKIISSLIFVALKTLLVLVSTWCVCGCVVGRTSGGQWARYEEWDVNGNHEVEKSEFVECYMNSALFEKWTKDSRFLTYDQLTSSMFELLDRDHNAELDSTEQHAMRTLYYFGKPIPAEWDLDGNKNVTLAELRRTDQLILQDFDRDVNEKISSEEMASAMFARSDDNNDGTLGALEFYRWLIYR